MRVNKQLSGFTLIEMAIVLTIVGFLAATFLMPLSAQIDQANVTKTRRDLLEIQEALLGYAVVNSRLPCPDTSGDGVEDACANTNPTSSTGGNVPWVTLGVESTDPWGRNYQYRVNNAFTTTFTLSTTGSGSGVIRVCTDSGCTLFEVNNVPAVIYSSGKNGGVQPPVGSDELENTTLTGNAKFDRNFVDHDFTPPTAANGEFDDIVTWLSPNVLFNRMVAAGKLP